MRRIFEHLGYNVKNLDRVLYAGLTKKNVDRGRWRFLNEKEVRILKYLNASYKPTVKEGKQKAEKPAPKEEKLMEGDAWDLNPKEGKPRSPKRGVSKPGTGKSRLAKPREVKQKSAKPRDAKSQKTKAK